MKTLYIADLDGTLLNRESRVSEYSRETLNKLMKEGLPLTYATARSFASSSIVTKELSLSLPVIVYNGGFLVGPATGKRLYKNLFRPEQIREVSQTLIKAGISPLVYSFINGIERVSWIYSGENGGLRHYIDSRKGDSRLTPLADKSHLFDG